MSIKKLFGGIGKRTGLFKKDEFIERNPFNVVLTENKPVEQICSGATEVVGLKESKEPQNTREIVMWLREILAEAVADNNVDAMWSVYNKSIDGSQEKLEASNAIKKWTDATFVEATKGGAVNIGLLWFVFHKGKSSVTQEKAIETIWTQAVIDSDVDLLWRVFNSNCGSRVKNGVLADIKKWSTEMLDRAIACNNIDWMWIVYNKSPKDSQEHSNAGFAIRKWSEKTFFKASIVGNINLMWVVHDKSICKNSTLKDILSYAISSDSVDLMNEVHSRIVSDDIHAGDLFGGVYKAMNEWAMNKLKVAVSKDDVDMMRKIHGKLIHYLDAKTYAAKALLSYAVRKKDYDITTSLCKYGSGLTESYVNSFRFDCESRADINIFDMTGRY